MEILTYNGLQIYDSELKQYIGNMIGSSLAESIVQVDSFIHFPLIGQENAVYIDQSENRVYRWNDEKLEYYCIGADYNDIDVINGHF